MTAETPPITIREEIRRINKRMDKQSDRIWRIEKLVYVILGIVTTTGAKVFYDLLSGIGAS